jgi:hypothetical protein
MTPDRDRARLQKALAEAEQTNGVTRAAVLSLLLLAACTSPEGRLQACLEEGKSPSMCEAEEAELRWRLIQDPFGPNWAPREAPPFLFRHVRSRPS